MLEHATNVYRISNLYWNPCPNRVPENPIVHLRIISAEAEIIAILDLQANSLCTAAATLEEGWQRNAADQVQRRAGRCTHTLSRHTRGATHCS